MTLSSDTFIWKEGYPDWKPIKDFTELGFPLNANEMYNKKQDESGNSKVKSFSWGLSIFGTVAYIIVKYTIFRGEMSFTWGFLSFVVGALIGTFLVSLFTKGNQKDGPRS